MKYHVHILDPAMQFIGKLDFKLKAKTFRTIELLEEYGPALKLPHSKKIEGIANLYELRIRHGSNICRLFYFHKGSSIYIITSGYIKKSQKLSRAEMRKAYRIMKIFHGGE